MWVGAGDGRAAGCVRGVSGRGPLGRCRFLSPGGLRQLAVLVALGQDLDREIRAVALAQATSDAVGGLDDCVVSEDEAVLGADLDADVAALAPFIDPPDVDEVDDRWGAMGASLGSVWSGRG